MQTLELGGLQELNHNELVKIDGGYDPILQAWNAVPNTGGSGSFDNTGNGEWVGAVFNTMGNGIATGFSTFSGITWQIS